MMDDETAFTNPRSDVNRNSIAGREDDGLFASSNEDERTLVRGRPSRRSRKSLRRRNPAAVAPAEGQLNVDVPDLFSSSYGTFENPAADQRDSTVGVDVFTVDRPVIKEKTLLDRLKGRWARFKSSVDEVISIFQVSRTLECYGGGVYSYFSFVLWLGKVNLFIMLLYLGALVLPYGFVSPDLKFGATLQNISQSVVAYVNTCSHEYQKSIDLYIENRTTLVDQLFDFLQGTGIFEKFNFLFIGQYFDKVFYRSNALQVEYNTSLGFYLCLWSTLCVLLIATMISSGKRVIKRVTNQEHETRYTFKVLARWDYIVRDKERAKVEKTNICNELKKELSEEQRKKRKERMTGREKRRLYGKRVLVWIVYLIVTAGSLVGIYFVNKKSRELSQNSSSQDVVVGFIIQYLLSFYIVFTNFIIEIFCKKIVQFEEYSANREIVITIGRTVSLRFVALVVLMGSLFIDLSACARGHQQQQFSANAKCYTGNNCKTLQCWETYVGQQIYKLVFLDLILFIGISFFDLFRKLVHSKCCKKLGLAEFDITKNVIDLIYAQTLCWLGMFFCPLLPIVLFVKIIAVYLFKKICVKFHVYEHDKKSTNATQTDSYFLDTLLFALIVVTFFPLGVATSVFAPSRSCGPYRLYFSESSNTKLQGARIALSYTVERAFERLGAEAKLVFDYIDSFMVSLPLLIVLFLITYYYYTLSKARGRLVDHLQLQMVHEMQDQAFLQRRALESMKALRIAHAANRA